MTVDIHVRPAEQAPGDDRKGRHGSKGNQPLSGRTARGSGKAPLVVGGQPRASPLPPEIVLKRKQLKTRRALRLGVFLVLIATVAACAGVWTLASVSQVALTLTQDRQAALVQEQLQYSDVRAVQTTIETIQAGQMVGASTEIDLRDYLAKLQSTLPDGVRLETVQIELGTPMSAYGQSDLPLQGARVGAITFTATTKTLPNLPEWLRRLESLPGFVDATPGSVKLEEGVYVADVLMHIDDGAFSGRFDPERIAEAEQAEQPGAAGSPGQNGGE